MLDSFQVMSRTVSAGERQSPLATVRGRSMPARGPYHCPGGIHRDGSPQAALPGRGGQTVVIDCRPSVVCAEVTVVDAVSSCRQLSGKFPSPKACTRMFTGGRMLKGNQSTLS